MPTVHALFPVCRTTENLTFYLWEGKYFVRKKSSLTRRRVKRSPQFAKTRYYAGLMKQASKIGSSLFQALPVRWRQSWMYRTFTGEAMKLLKEEKTKKEVKEILWVMYVKEVQEAACSLSRYNGTGYKGNTDSPLEDSAGKREKRPYTKRDTLYWQCKKDKANKRQSRRAKLQYYAGLLGRASVISSTVYKSLPVRRQKHDLYKAITALAMELLKEEWDDESLKEYLMKQVLAQDEGQPRFGTGVHLYQVKASSGKRYVGLFMLRRTCTGKKRRCPKSKMRHPHEQEYS